MPLRNLKKASWLDDVPARVLIEIAANPEKFKADLEEMNKRKAEAVEAEGKAAALVDAWRAAKNDAEAAAAKIEIGEAAQDKKMEAGIAAAKALRDAAADEKRQAKVVLDQARDEKAAIEVASNALENERVALKESTDEVMKRDADLTVKATRLDALSKSIADREAALNAKLDEFRRV